MVFAVNNERQAKNIILTPEGGTTTDGRWEKETEFLQQDIGEFLNPTEQMLILDYGCGIGRLAKELINNHACRVLGVDISASMRYGDGRQQKLLTAAQMAATLGYSILRQSDKVSLTTFDNQIRGVIRPSNSMGQILRITQHLDETKAVEKTDIGECLDDAVSRMGRREVVMIFSDFFCDLEELENSLQRMRYHRHEVVLFQVLHHDEVAFEFDAMTKFVGLEIPDELLTQPEDLRDEYLRAIRKFNDELRSMAERNQTEYVLVDTGRSLGETLSDYLNLRNRVRSQS